jgi:hypothetical protein
MNSEDRKLHYVNFLKAFDHGTGKGCEHPPRPCGSPDPAESLEWLSPGRAAGRIRELVTSMDILHKVRPLPTLYPSSSLALIVKASYTVKRQQHIQLTSICFSYLQ